MTAYPVCESRDISVDSRFASALGESVRQKDQASGGIAYGNHEACRNRRRSIRLFALVEGSWLNEVALSGSSGQETRSVSLKMLNDESLRLILGPWSNLTFEVYTLSDEAHPFQKLQAIQQEMLVLRQSCRPLIARKKESVIIMGNFKIKVSTKGTFPCTIANTTIASARRGTHNEACTRNSVDFVQVKNAKAR